MIEYVRRLVRRADDDGDIVDVQFAAELVARRAVVGHEPGHLLVTLKVSEDVHGAPLFVLEGRADEDVDPEDADARAEPRRGEVLEAWHEALKIFPDDVAHIVYGPEVNDRRSRIVGARARDHRTLVKSDARAGEVAGVEGDRVEGDPVSSGVGWGPVLECNALTNCRVDFVSKRQ